MYLTVCVDKNLKKNLKKNKETQTKTKRKNPPQCEELPSVSISDKVIWLCERWRIVGCSSYLIYLLSCPLCLVKFHQNFSISIGSTPHFHCVPQTPQALQGLNFFAPFCLLGTLEAVSPLLVCNLLLPWCLKHYSPTFIFLLLECLTPEPFSEMPCMVEGSWILSCSHLLLHTFLYGLRLVVFSLSILFYYIFRPVTRGLISLERAQESLSEPQMLCQILVQDLHFGFQ